MTLLSDAQLATTIAINRDQMLRELDRCEYEESLYAFLKAGWQFIDPSTFVDGWPMEAICEHLEAVVSGDIRRLIINVPPRCAKSSTVSVAFPAWVWAQRRLSPTSGPGVQFLAASYAQQLSLRDSVKCRRLIESPWYQELWGGRFRLSTDQNVKSRYANDQKGERLCTSVDSAVTGEGGSIILIDDPNAAQEAFSEATIESTITWWDTTMSTRLNDPKTGAFVVIQQRLAEEDLSGHILSKSKGEWTHLMLPMLYERDRSFVTSIGWEDPRTEEGELLWPERFGQDEVGALQISLGPFAAAGQLQQRPEPKGGGIIKRDYWQMWEGDNFPPVSLVVASLDTAYTEKTENDYSALTVWGVFDDVAMGTSANRRIAPGGRLYELAPRPFQANDLKAQVILMGAWQERLELNPLVEKVAKTCKDLKVDRLLIEAKASGMSVAQEIRRVYGHEKFGVQLINPGAQDKVARAYSIQHLFSEGMVYAPDRAYADMVITQCAQFPKGKHDDLVDSTTMGVRWLRDIGVLHRGVERSAEIEDDMRHRGGPPPPLYPGA